MKNLKIAQLYAQFEGQDNIEPYIPATHMDAVFDDDQNTVGDIINDMQDDINQLKLDGTTIGFSASPSVVFADGGDKSITLTATSNPYKADIVVDGDTRTNVNSTTFQKTVNSTSQQTISYSAAFTVNGVQKGTRTASVSLVYRIYYGAGQTLSNATMTGLQSAQTSPAGTYSITIGQNNHLYFEVPNGMRINKVQLTDNPNFPTDVTIHTISTSRTGLDGSAYTAYESDSTFAAGTHNFKLS